MQEREKQPMVRTIAATQARIHFGEVLRRVYKGHEHLIIEKDGLPVAAILSHAEYERYQRLLALQQFEELGRSVSRKIKAKGWTEEQVIKSIDKAQEEVIAEKYGRAIRSR